MHLHWLQHDVDARWNASPALLKSRQGRPASAVGLAPQPNSRVLVRADMAVQPDPTLCKRLGGAEDLVHELSSLLIDRTVSLVCRKPSDKSDTLHCPA